jgi:hypothetical protein
MAQSLQDQHPDVATVVEKWNRYQHKVDYTPFKNNQLKLKKGVQIKQGVDEYNMELIQYKTPKSIFYKFNDQPY